MMNPKQKNHQDLSTATVLLLDAVNLLNRTKYRMALDNIGFYDKDSSGKDDEGYTPPPGCENCPVKDFANPD